MTYEEAKDKAMLYSIDPSLTCSCDEVHVCQQCSEEYDDIDLLFLEKLQPNNGDIDTSTNIIVDTSKIKDF
jgi:hypothetical protein